MSDSHKIEDECALIKELIRRARSEALGTFLQCQALKAIPESVADATARLSLAAARYPFAHLAPKLRALLNHKDRLVGGLAAQAVIALAGHDPDLYFATEVISALAGSLHEDSSAFSHLDIRQWLQDKPELRESVRRVFCHLIPKLVDDFCVSGQADVREAACSCLCQIRRHVALPRYHFYAIVRLLDCSYPETQSAAVFVLQGYGWEASIVLERVLPLLDQERCKRDAIRLRAWSRTAGMLRQN